MVCPFCFALFVFSTTYIPTIYRAYITGFPDFRGTLGFGVHPCLSSDLKKETNPAIFEKICYPKDPKDPPMEGFF